MEEKVRCYNCMERKPARFKVCPYCGYSEDTKYDPNYAPPGTELNDRYILGVMIGHNSEGANYIGYNSAIGCKVLIREYMPVNLCHRVPGRATISVPAETCVNFKTLMSEFKDLNRKLAQMRNLQHIIPTLDIIEANNTTYVIYEYLEGIKLIEYLNKNAGELTWQQVSALFPTFFTTLSLMHNNHVYHRSISPDTIYITPKGELRICGFSIYSVRTMHLELPCEIFEGYAAPEQYTPGARQGAFTDVYGICAVLYRILTGTRPIDVPSRLLLDNLTPPKELNPNIPKNVSDAIFNGMRLDSRQRTQTITELVTQLFEQTEPDPVEKPEQKPVQKEPVTENHVSSMERLRTPLTISVMALCAFLILAIVILSILNKDGSFHMNYSSESIPAIESTTENHIIIESSVATETEPSTEILGDSQMPLLIGSKFEVKKTQLETDGWLYLEPVYAFSDNYEAGLIMEQEILAGSPFKSGSTVKVVVSRGPSAVQIPDYTGKSLKDYEAELDAIGIKYITEAVVNYEFETGYVVELSRNAGEIFDLAGEDTLKIFYASNPETTPAPETMPTQTLPPETVPTETVLPTENRDDSGVELETAPPLAPDPTENYSEWTEEAPETAPSLTTTVTIDE